MRARDDLRTDAVVVGGGITGLTTALFLAEAGLRVAVVERARLGAGTTGATTAHVTAFLDVDLAALASRIGDDAARRVIAASQAAIDDIEKLAREARDACSFARVPGFRFTEDPARAEALERECEIARRLGLEARMAEAPPLQAPCVAALRIERQAQISPLAYLDWLAAALVARGGLIFERSPVRSADDAGVVVADGTRIEARFVIRATHSPIGVVASQQTRLRALMSYVLAARLESPLEPALYWDDRSPYHYVRTADQGRIALIGGEDHATGCASDQAQRIQALERWARARLPLGDVVARWSAEFFEPADGLPYIGFLPGSSTQLVATGFSGTGLTFGTVAARVITGLVTDTPGAPAELFSPRRIGPMAALGDTARESARTAWHFVADRLKPRTSAGLDQVPIGSGRVLRIDGQLVAAHRDAQGEIHLHSARCTHLGCIVAWNDFEKTWDCPCHGGRFQADGQVLCAPPLADLNPAPKR